MDQSDTASRHSLPLLRALLQSLKLAPTSVPDTLVALGHLRSFADSGVIYATDRIESAVGTERAALQWQIDSQQQLRYAVDRTLERLPRMRVQTAEQLWHLAAEELAMGGVRAYRDIVVWLCACAS